MRVISTFTSINNNSIANSNKYDDGESSAENIKDNVKQY